MRFRTMGWALCLLALMPAVRAVAFPTTGPQRLLVVPVEYAHVGCPPDTDGFPTCPRNTAAQLQQLIQDGLNSYYNGPATGFKVSWQVRVLANPDTADGWWPAPSTLDQLTAASKQPNANNFTTSGSAVRDTAEIVVSRALTRGVMTPAELTGYTRLVSVHNWHGFGGQSSGAVPITYTTVAVIGGKPTTTPYNVTAAFVNEGSRDSEMINVMQHELGHELGPRDFYGSPCNFRPPDDPPYPPSSNPAFIDDVNDCVGSWDVMGATPSFGSNVAFGYYTRSLLGWVSTYPPEIRYEPAAFSGPVSLSSLEYPDGDPLALHIPEDPARLVLARAFGQSGFFQGFLVECRRTPYNDPLATPVRGVTISYIDSTRLPSSAQVFARYGYSYAPGFLRQQASSAALTFANDTWFSLSRGISIEFNGFNAKGGCDLTVNRTVAPRNDVAFGPVVRSNDSSAIPALGMGLSKSVYANPGLVVNAPRLPIPKKIAGRASAHAVSRTAATASVARRAVRVGAPARGKPSIIRFTYGNVGGGTGGATATVRVQQPWVATPACAGVPPQPAGRVVARVKLPKLASGEAGVGQVRWVPRSGEAAAISVSFQSPGQAATDTETATTVLAFQTHRRGTNGRSGEARTKIIIAVPKSCSGPVAYALRPAILPSGWTVRIIGANQRIAPGQRRTVTIAVRAPKRGAAATDLPISVLFGQPGAEPPAENPAGSPPLSTLPTPSSSTGIDVMARVNARGRPAPAFVLPAPAGMRTDTATSPGTNPNTGSPNTPQSIAITGCARIPGNQMVPVSGTLNPPRAAAPITITYTAVPGGQVVVHHVTTDAAGGSFQDVLDQPNSWSAVASTDTTHGFADATSPPCSVV